MGKGEILVVGGAGYIGSQCCKELRKAGYTPVTLDNLRTGHRENVRWGPLIRGDLSDRDLLDRVLRERPIRGVMHFAAFALVGESVERPGAYYRNNVAGTLALLEAMVRRRVETFIFSSTAAVFGVPDRVPIDEGHPKEPINPYGRSKLMVERMLEDFDRAHGLRYTALRYFNAAGADPDGETGEKHDPETHLIPLVLGAALGERDPIKVFGTDYDTPDGTCIRDYVHTVDLASAHILALERLLGGGSSGVYNLGNGRGYSVLEVIDTVRKVTGRGVRVREVGRRPGDPDRLVASSDMARGELGWEPRYEDLAGIIRTAYDWAGASASARASKTMT